MRPLHALNLFAVVTVLGVLAGCHDAVRSQVGCESDDDCFGARTCIEGLCVDPAVADAGADAAPDVVPDVVPDADLAELPDPPPPQRCLEATGSTLDFGVLEQGESTARRVTLRNCGVLEVAVEAVSVEDPSGVFELTRTPELPVALAAGETVDLVVRATPAGPGAWSGVLVAIAADAAPVTLPLVVEALAPVGSACLRFAPASLAFGVIAAGSERVAEVLLRSCSSADVGPLVWTGPADPSLRIEGAPSNIAPGETVALTVTWSAQAEPQALADAITVALDATGPVARLPVTGVSVRADDGCLELVPPSVELPDTEVGASVFGTALLRNCGESVLDLAPALVSDDSFGITYAVGPLEPGEEREVALSWSPRGTGLQSTAWRVPTAVGVEYGPWLVYGTGVPGEPPVIRGPAIELRPPAADLGPWPVGTRVPLAFEVCNPGDAPLLLEGATGEGAVEVPDAAWATATVAPGTCGVAAAVLQVGDGERSAGSVRVRSNARNASVATFTATATSVEVSPELCLQAVNDQVLVSAQPGRAIDGELSFVNCGAAALTVLSVESAAVVAAGDAAIELGADPGPGAQVPPGGQLTVRFVVSADSPQNAIWRVTARSREGAVSSAIVSLTVADEPASCVEPVVDVVNFGVVAIGQITRRDVRFRNCGTSSVTLSRSVLRAVTGSGFSVDADVAGSVVAPGAEFLVGVVLRPGELGGVSAELRAGVPVGGSSAPAVLRAEVVEQPDPDRCIEVEPALLDLGTVELGTVREQPVLVRNCGEGEILVVRYRLTSGGSGWGLLDGESFVEIPPGEVAPIPLVFEAFRPGRANDTLEIYSDATPEGVIEVALRATVGEDVPGCTPPALGVSTDPAGPFEPALAVRPNTQLYLDASFADSSARGIWSVLDAPRGAARAVIPAEAPSPDGRIPSYGTTVEGTYVFGFRWEDAAGCSGEESVFVDVRASSGVGEGLRVVVTWRTPGDPDELTDPGSDVDLHLVRRVGGRVRWNSEDDCYYANPSPSWGPGGTEDDPRLLRDEVDGLGPEIIVLESPSEVIYYIGVYYFAADGFGPSDATLRVFYDGVQIGSATRRLNRTGDFWLAASVTNLGETVAFLPGDNWSGFPTGVP